MDCSFIDMEFQSEKIYGFHSVFNFKCKMCGIESKIYSENTQQECVPINKAIINGCQAIGKIYCVVCNVYTVYTYI